MLCTSSSLILIFFFNVSATTEIYTLSLHDALPISSRRWLRQAMAKPRGWIQEIGASELPWTSSVARFIGRRRVATKKSRRSEEHTSELQSLTNLVCRLLLEKKK